MSREKGLPTSQAWADLTNAAVTGEGTSPKEPEYGHNRLTLCLCLFQLWNPLVAASTGAWNFFSPSCPSSLLSLLLLWPGEGKHHRTSSLLYSDRVIILCPGQLSRWSFERQRLQILHQNCASASKDKVALSAKCKVCTGIYYIFPRTVLTRPTPLHRRSLNNAFAVGCSVSSNSITLYPDRQSTAPAGVVTYTSTQKAGPTGHKVWSLRQMNGQVTRMLSLGTSCADIVACTNGLKRTTYLGLGKE